jgi:hypothetical protein
VEIVVLNAVLENPGTAVDPQLLKLQETAFGGRALAGLSLDLFDRF